MSTIQTVGILGAGIMGAEIALCFANAGCKVLLKDISTEAAQKGKDRLSKPLDKAIQKGKYTEEKKVETLEKIVPLGDYQGFDTADLVVEAVFENMDLKKKLLVEVADHCKSDCIIATNTSSIPITQLGACLPADRRPLFIGAHFFAPAFIMKLVEVIPGAETSEETTLALLEACRMIGKTPIRVKDTAGFVVNRMLFAFFNEAVRLVDEGVASIEDIDTACRLGLGHPIGPLALMDMADLGMALDVSNLLKESYGDRFRFGTALRQKVYAGHIGRKAGQGWYDYRK